MIISTHGIIASSGQTLTQFMLTFGGLYQSIDPTISSNVSLNAGNISQVNDTAGNNLHVVQSTAARQPLYSIGGFNGKNAIYFDGGNDCLTTANYVEGTFTKWFVTDFESPSGFIEEANNGAHYSYLFGNTGSSGEIGRIVSAVSVQSAFNVTSAWNLGKRIICWQFDGTFAGHRLWINGVLTRTSTGAGNPGTSTLAVNLNLGSRNNGASNPSKGWLAYRGAFNRSMNDTEIAQIFTRLNTEFAVY